MSKTFVIPQKKSFSGAEERNVTAALSTQTPLNMPKFDGEQKKIYIDKFIYGLCNWLYADRYNLYIQVAFLSDNDPYLSTGKYDVLLYVDTDQITNTETFLQEFLRQYYNFMMQ